MRDEWAVFPAEEARRLVEQTKSRLENNVISRGAESALADFLDEAIVEIDYLKENPLPEWLGDPDRVLHHLLKLPGVKAGMYTGTEATCLMGHEDMRPEEVRELLIEAVEGFE